MSATQPSLSLIIPVYNESKIIRESLSEIGEFLALQSYPADIVIVDDGSGDDTFELVREISTTLAIPVRAIRYETNRGKGYAIKVGFDAARGERLAFTDCDLSTPLAEIVPMLAVLDEGYDFVIGSRKTAGSNITRHQPWLRERLGMIFTALVRVLIADVSDVTCGFKVYQRDVGRALFSRLRVEDWSFDAELLWIAKRRGYRLCEVPVRWENNTDSRVSLLRDSVNSLIGIARIRINAAMGRYEVQVDVDPSSVDWSNDVKPPETHAKG